jgi:ABC-type multidrug transport system fused ATPase/permease subunit
MRGLRTPTQEQAGILIAMAAIIFGGCVRLLIPWIAGFPVNDGDCFI